ncbi:MAG: circadian clock protein KaiB [Candidatus Competibacteraceae bacterium]|nr:circadian clock protein KaiB [Candidatus Competibacteraceae bacterium]
MGKHLLKLYVAGENRRTDQALSSARKIVDELQDGYRLEVIDVLLEPQLAQFASILATPTLVKDIPPPSRRLLGDLSNTRDVLNKLGLKKNI